MLSHAQQKQRQPLKPSPAGTEAPAREAPKRKHSLGFGLTFSSINYTQTALTPSPVQTLLLNPKVDYRYQLSQNWSLGASGFFTAAALSSNLSAGQSLKFFGANWRLAYRLTDPAQPWAADLSAGTFYETTSVSGTTFGYQNLTGPQAQFRVGRAFQGNKKTVGLLSLFGRYSLISNGFSLYPASNHQYAGGASWTGRLGPGQWSITAEYSRLNFTIAPDTIDSKVISGGLGYQLAF